MINLINKSYLESAKKLKFNLEILDKPERNEITTLDFNNMASATDIIIERVQNRENNMKLFNSQYTTELTKTYNTNKLAITGFCWGGRIVWLYSAHSSQLKAGVAWYGFPYRTGFANGTTKPIDYLDSLTAPMLMIHGSADQASPVTDIYRYASALNQSQKYFELKVYEGQPHGFEIQNGVINDSDIGRDAFLEMVTFFDRKLNSAGNAP